MRGLWGGKGASTGALLLGVAMSVAVCGGGPGWAQGAAGTAAVGVMGLERGVLPERWATGGPRCMELPEWQVQEYNRDLYILRQSGCTDFEKPFLYLIFGRERALLLDTGSRKGNLVPTLSDTMHRWLTRTGRAGIPLVVVHTHEHGDHVAGDAGLQAWKDAAIPVTLIAATVEANKSFYGMATWPESLGSVDLGARVLDAIAIPGHSEAGVALYDRRTGTLFTGDTLYPGRLYVRDLAAFGASVDRLVRFTASRPVAEVLGNHIEQRRTPFLDYPDGTLYQPEEHVLELSRGALLELQEAVSSLHGKPARVALRDFTIWPSGGTAAERAEEEKAFEQTQKVGLARRWGKE